MIFYIFSVENSFAFKKRDDCFCNKEKQNFFLKKKNKRKSKIAKKSDELDNKKNEKKFHYDEEEICKWEKPILNSSSKNTESILEDKNNSQKNYKKIDPWEKKNKKILKINMFLFRNTILPFVYLIDAWTPKSIQNLFINFTQNFLEPKNYIIYKLTGEHEKAKKCGERFFINTFLGGGGMINAAEEKYGLKYARYNEKFDYIFYKKNIDKGRYIILPIANQYFEREFAAELMEWLVNPIFYFTLPFNYLYYILYRSCLLTDKKDTLFYNRKYDESVYNNLRDLNFYEVSNYE